MRFLVDTNVLLRSAEPGHPMYALAINATTTLLGRGEELGITPQNLIEFWNVYTRPVERNGLGHTVAEAETEVNRLKELFPLLLDLPAIYGEWERLVIAHAVMGVNVHDARLVAAMLVHGLTHKRKPGAWKPSLFRGGRKRDAAVLTAFSLSCLW